MKMFFKDLSQKIRQFSFESVIAFFVLAVLFVVGILFILGEVSAQTALLKWSLLILSIPLWYDILRDIIRGDFGVDLIAGVALVGALLFDQYLAGMFVLLMLSGGQSFEAYALRRARRDLKNLLSHAPEKAHVERDGHVVDVPVSQIQVGEHVVIKPGEIVPVDGTVITGSSLIDESILTGESIPVEKNTGNNVFAGTENTNGVLHVQVTKPANETAYQRIVSLVENAEKSRAPFVRLADRYSVFFTILTFALALIAWLLSHDPTRVLAVLVVATPCPLILATPIAIVSGMSAAAKRGVIIKAGGALESLAHIKTLLFDKTGTITLGTPKIVKVDVLGSISEKEIIQIAASLDQFSSHILAQSFVDEARKRNISFITPEGFKEDFGNGVTGKISGKQFFFGKLSYIQKNISFEDKKLAGEMHVYLSGEDGLLGRIVLSDVPRHNAGEAISDLRDQGVSRIVMLTGDTMETAKHIGEALNISEIKAEYSPEDKLSFIEQLPKTDLPVAMIGDGVNDAPALARADVGIAFGTHGATAASDVADIVIPHSSLAKVSIVYRIARLTFRVARQGIFLGIGLSTIFMVFALFGFIRPVVGAFIQEAIDILVILNALRIGMLSRSLNV